MSLFSTPRTLEKFAKLQDNPDDLRNVSQLVFPEDILSGFGNGHFILINFNRLAGSKYKDKNYRIENPAGDITSNLGNGSEPVFYGRGYTIQNQIKGGGRYERSKESIIFPMPESIANTHGIEWTAVELGAAARLVREVSSFGDNSMKDIGRALAESAKSTAAKTVEALTGVQAAQVSELYTGTITNPFLEVLFKGVNTRTHSLDFKFSPKNHSESSTLSEIIRRLKFHAHPEFKYRENEGSYLLYPSNVDITFMKVEGGEATRNVWLHRFNTSAIVGITEDASSGGYAVHNDHSPVVRSLSLQLQEVAPLRKSDFLSAEDSF